MVFRVVILFCLLSSASARAQDDVLRFAVIADLNGSYGSTSYRQDVYQAIDSIVKSPVPVDVVLSAGDMVAGQKAGLDYKRMWEVFHQTITAPLNQAQIAFAPSPGNHDASAWAAFSQERAEYQLTFSARSPGPTLGKFELLAGSNFPFHYAFLLKGALFVALDATIVGLPDAPQMEWLKQTLAAHSSAALKVVYGHVPLFPYSFGRAHEYMGAGNIDGALAFEKLLEDSGVKLFITGHHHSYYTGHRKGRVEFLSVPLLGEGPRKLLHTGTKNSPRGYLFFEYSPTLGLSMRALAPTGDMELKTKDLPTAIVVPQKDTTQCRGCKNFPGRGFIPNVGRKVYLRSDNLAAPVLLNLEER